MAKIGILFGMEDTFPWALIERIKASKIPGVDAEPVKVGAITQGVPTGYRLILDRISQDVPFYRTFLKNEVLCGTQVLNDPFWASADDKFFENCLATKLGVAVPKTVVLPHKNLPCGTTDKSMRNLVFPLDWDAIFAQIGFPAFLKRHSGCGGAYVFKVQNPAEFFEAYAQSGDHVMMLQESIKFEAYYRCFCINGAHVRVMPYEPRSEHAQHYRASHLMPSPALAARIVRDTMKLNHALGYDMNTCEFAVRNGVPVAIDFMNWSPDCDRSSIGDDNFNWVVEATANMLVDRIQKPRRENSRTSRPTWSRPPSRPSVGVHALQR
jgi:hypothetical protein